MQSMRCSWSRGMSSNVTQFPLFVVAAHCFVTSFCSLSKIRRLCHQQCCSAIIIVIVFHTQCHHPNRCSCLFSRCYLSLSILRLWHAVKKHHRLEVPHYVRTRYAQHGHPHDCTARAIVGPDVFGLLMSPNLSQLIYFLF